MSMTVKDYMQKKTMTILCGTRLSEVVDKLLKHHLSGAPVVNEAQELVGFVSEHDCLQPLIVSSYHCEGELLVNDVMSKELLTVALDDSIATLAEMMSQQKPKNYPVVSGGKLVGVLTRGDVLRALVSQSEACYR